MNLFTAFSWLNVRGSSDENTANAVGGIVHRFIADTTTLLVGDAVYISGAGIVNKSTTVANYATFVGFVVGGTSNSFRTDDAVGTTAATSGQAVAVQISGIARAIVGATGFTAGTSNVAVAASGATAGRVIPTAALDATIIAGRTLGVPTTTQATAGSEVKVLIQHF
jgi:hypothetical protein